MLVITRVLLWIGVPLVLLALSITRRRKKKAYQTLRQMKEECLGRGSYEVEISELAYEELRGVVYRTDSGVRAQETLNAVMAAIYRLGIYEMTLRILQDGKLALQFVQCDRSASAYQPLRTLDFPEMPVDK